MRSLRFLPVAVLLGALFLLAASPPVAAEPAEGKTPEAEQANPLVFFVSSALAAELQAAGLTLDEDVLAEFYLGGRTMYKRKRIVAVDYTGGPPAKVRLVTSFLGMAPRAYARHWLTLVLKEGVRKPPTVVSLEEMLRRVAAETTWLGYALRSELPGQELPQGLLPILSFPPAPPPEEESDPPGKDKREEGRLGPLPSPYVAAGQAACLLLSRS